MTEYKIRSAKHISRIILLGGRCLGLEESVHIVPPQDLVPHEGEDEEGAEDTEGSDEEWLLVQKNEGVEEEQNKRLFMHSDQHLDTCTNKRKVKTMRKAKPCAEG